MSPRARALINRISRCSRRQPCLSAVCPKCFRRYRIWLIGEVSRILLESGPLSFVTLIPGDSKCANLRNIEPPTIINRLRQQLRRAKVDGPVIGGLDGEYDADACFFQPHFHLICRSDQVPAIREVAAQHYRRSEHIYRPCEERKVHGLVPLIGYIAKGFWQKKTRYGVTKKRVARRLDEPMHAEWLLWRSDFGFCGLQIFYGLRRYAGRLEPLSCNRCLPNEGADRRSSLLKEPPSGQRRDSSYNGAIRGGVTLENRTATAATRITKSRKQSAQELAGTELSWREREEALRLNTISGRKLTKRQRKQLR